MPGPVIKDPTAWLRADDSVMDQPWVRYVRAIVKANPIPDKIRPTWMPNLNPLSELEDSESQVLSLMAPLSVAKKGANTLAPLLAKAKELYLQWGGGTERHVPRMAQALKVAGIKLPARTASEKLAAHAYVNKLLDEIHTPAPPLEGPFAPKP
jgi:hypothetical protein